jgi:hypothetical protein
MIDNVPFKRLYIPTHTNLGCYLIGIWAGYMMHKLKVPSRTLWHKIFFHLITFGGFVVIMSGYIFYIYEFEKPSLWCALFAGLQKVIFGFGLTYLLWCFSVNIESKYKH